MVPITTSDIRAYIAERQAATEVVRDAYTITRADGTAVKMPETRRTVAGVANATINSQGTVRLVVARDGIEPPTP